MTTNPHSLASLRAIPLALMSVCGGLAAQDYPKGEHGAVAMEAQRDILSELRPLGDVRQPPADVDPYIWEHVVVPKMRAMEAYIYAQRKGEALQYGKR